MTPERWKEVEEILQAALDRPAQERASFLAEACMGDDGLKREAISLIHAYDEAGDFIEQPAIAQEALHDSIWTEITPTYSLRNCRQ